jgi:hypothetical protein
VRLEMYRAYITAVIYTACIHSKAYIYIAKLTQTQTQTHTHTHRHTDTQTHLIYT